MDFYKCLGVIGKSIFGIYGRFWFKMGFIQFSDKNLVLEKFDRDLKYSYGE